MKILLTNDDGIQSPGLGALEDRLSSDHEIWVLAPDNERSGSSHAITLKGAVRMRNLSPRHISCNGTPADCVLYGLLGVLPERPDIVLSGINIGHNLGTDIVYSGTA
ncbi:MAG: 5'/3'-nucleotidase SurE, partial [Spirochaetales bacterium]